MSVWIGRTVSGVAVGVFLTFLAWFVRRLEALDERRKAVAALRFELESNLGWLDDVLKTHNYLRDEAWVILKDKGYISHLCNPIPMQVIKVYGQLHRLNEHSRVLKEKVPEPNGALTDPDAASLKTDLETSIQTLISKLDTEYSKIGENFQAT